jgi:Mg2+-importing ATPase
MVAVHAGVARPVCVKSLADDTTGVREHYWAIPIEQLLEQLRTSATGLSSSEAADRLRAHGENRLRPAHRGPLAEAILSQLRNPLLWLLLIAAVIGIAVGERTDAVIVIAIMLFSAILSIWQEGRAGRALERLRARVAARARVIRDNVELEVPASSVVPGDVLVLAAGTLIAADAVLLEARDLYLGEAALTGEAFAVAKRPGDVPEEAPVGQRTNVVHMGTSVRSGTGRAVVVRTGGATEFGHVAKRLALRAPETEFQQGLRRFGYLLLSLMLVLVFVVFTASVLRAHRASEALLFAIALSVGLAPEMLPAILATMLSRGARRMSKRGVLVRRLEAIENLGNMDVLCTDKTGTLTEGEIALESSRDCAGRESQRVLQLGYQNAKAQAGLPNPLDRALVAAGEQHGLAAARKLDEIPFDFSRKRLSVLVDDGPVPLLICKGAFESVLSVCSSARADDDAVVPIDAALRERLRADVATLNEQGVRVIGVATREHASTQPLDHEAERELVLEGILAFRDPLKPGVSEAIASLRELGVTVKVVSGDQRAVVHHVAQQIGMTDGQVLTGSELASLKDEALWNLVERVHLFAEVDPGQKERILRALAHTGHVVGFMGDGINDAPAMHAADVGISVEGATDVAREAADFVLLERELGTVRDGIIEGRVTFANTLKYVLTTESANLGNMLSMAAAALFLPFLPLLAHQILLNNLLSDVPSVTLSGDRVDPEVVRTPQRWDIGFIRRFMIGFGLLSAAFDALTFLILRLVFDADAETFRTAWFAESLLTELLVLLVLRTRRPFWTSLPHPALLGSTLLMIAVTAILLLTPLHGVFEFVSLPGSMVLTIVGIALAYMLTVEMLKRPLLRAMDRGAVRQHRERRRIPASHRVWPH